jgi:hypothetical protein
VASSTPYAATVEFIDRLRDSLICVLEQVHLPFSPRMYRGSNDPYSIMLNDGIPQPLSSSLISGLAIQLAMFIRPFSSESGYGIELSGYSYLLGIRQRDGLQEFLAWQWNQRGVSSIAYPHLHVSAVSEAVPGGLNKLHIPTNQILVEDILEFIITDLGVEPRREDWREIFETSR